MKKAIIFSLLSLLFIAHTYAVAPASTLLVRHFKQNNIATSYNVRIRLVHTDGSPVTGSTGLHGYWVRNAQTGVYYDPSNQEGDEFEGLPAGTYTFGAYPGNWDGAVSKTVTLDPGQVGADGFIEVTLVYWVE